MVLPDAVPLADPPPATVDTVFGAHSPRDGDDEDDGEVLAEREREAVRDAEEGRDTDADADSEPLKSRWQHTGSKTEFKSLTELAGL